MQFKEHKTIDVVGIGNALMDILIEVDDSFLKEHDLTKGKMHLVDAAEAKAYLESIANRQAPAVPGGATANTIRGIAALGGSTVFYGSIGTSMYGGMYKDALIEAGIETKLHESETLTGNAITYITPDHERTFTTCLGAAAELPVSLVEEEVIANAKILYLEAFQFEGPTKEVLETAIAYAQKHGTLVALDLNDASLIERNATLFKDVVKKDIDIVLANEDETRAFGEIDSRGCTAVLKKGEDGADMLVDGIVSHVDAVPTEVVDTTGAGDLFAAGFLYGLTHEYTTEESAKLAAHTASEVITHVGVPKKAMDVITTFSR